VASKHSRIAWLIVIFLAAAGTAAGSWLVYGARRTPEGQPALQALDRSNLRAFRETFNAASDRTRLVALLSPT
jgi:hypothetical protein